MNFKNSTLLFLFLSLVCSPSFSQEKIRLKRLNLEDGLSQSTIHKIYQDIEGFVWIATQDGLNKYDGNKFTVYRPSLKNKKSICYNWINQIEEDSEGNIWLSTFYGLSRWNRSTNDFTNFLPENTPELRGTEFTALYCGKKDVVWFVNDKELGCYNIKTKKFKIYSKEKNKLPQLQPLRYSQILEDAKGKIWITTLDSGVVLIDKGNLKWLKENMGLTSNIIRSAMIGIDGEIWLSTPKGLLYFDSSNKKFNILSSEAGSNPKIPSSSVRSAIFDKNNNLWVVLNRDGIVKIDAKSKEVVHYKKSTNQSGIASDFYDESYIDNDGQIWFYGFSASDGFSIFSPKTNRFTNYGHLGDDFNLSSSEANEFFSGRDGEVWIGTDGGALYVYNSRLSNFKHIYKNSSADSTIDQNDVRMLLRDTKGRTWVGTHTGLNIRKSDNVGFYTVPLNHTNKEGLHSTHIYHLYQDKKERVWVATGDGIFLYDETKNNFKKIKIKTQNEPIDDEVRIVFEDWNGNLNITCNKNSIGVFDESNMIFNETEVLSFMDAEEFISIETFQKSKIAIGTWNGFFIYNFKTKKQKHYTYNYNDITSISNPEINQLKKQNDSILWLATANGINRFNINTEEFKYYFIEDGLPNQYTYNLLFDSHENIWISTNKGITRFNPKTETFRNYDVNDGLQSNEFNGGSASSNGHEFLFGGINGYNYFIPDSIKINSNLPLLYFSDLIVNSKKVVPGDSTNILKVRLEDTKTVIVNEGVDNLTIEFVGLDFSNVNTLEYYYSLNKTGEEEDWYKIEHSRSISLTNPENGNFLLKIKAKNKDGFESEIKELQIQILPPFYKTIWFNLFISVLLIILIIFIYRYRLNAIKKQKKALEILVEERTHKYVEQRDEAEKQKKIAIQQKEEVAIQKEIIEIKNKEIIDSIYYAKRIQFALLKNEEHVTEHLPSHFILFKPKDIVSGDFYWALEKQNHLYVTAADCTGHGVPGAFMSMLGIAYLNEINAGEEMLKPADVLDKLRYKITDNLSGDKGENKDGMDMSFYKLNMETLELEWAGSNNPLWLVTKKLNAYSEFINKHKNKVSVFKKNESDEIALIEIKPNKQSIGYNEIPEPFDNIFVQLNKEDIIYTFTDGFADQFGGEKGKKFKYKSLKELVIEINHLSMNEQKIKMNEVFESWRGVLEQIDDVCLLGFKV